MKLLIALLFAANMVSAQGGGSFIDSLRAEATAAGARVGISAMNLATGETISINADSLFPTASIIKLPVLVELFRQFHEGKHAPDEKIILSDSVKKPGSGVLQFLHAGQTLELQDIATLMIILSDNTATNYVIDVLGKDHEARLDAVNSTMRLIGLQHTKLLNKPYSFATKKNTDEARRFGIGVTTPSDMTLLLGKLARLEVVDSAASRGMIAILRNQQDIQLAARLLPFDRDTTLWIANKTGSLDHVKNDAGIVSNAHGTYMYAILCSDAMDAGEQVDNTATIAVAKISKMLHGHFLGSDGR